MYYDDDYYRKRKRNPEISRETLTLQNNVYKMQLQRYEIFKAQDPETGDFDFTLEFGEKKIYIHKFVVTPVSETLNAMFSVRWNKTGNNKMVIHDYSYDEFFQFICFIYSGGCDLTKENIFELTDMAEFYGVQTLKEYCDYFLSKIRYEKETFYNMVEFEERYTLKGLNESLQSYFSSYNMKLLIEGDDFVTLDKRIVKRLSTFKRSSDYEEDFLKAVFNWAQHQALTKQTAAGDEKNDMKEAVKKEFSAILPQIKFSKVNFDYLKDFIAENEYLFSRSELYEALMSSNRNWRSEERFFVFIYKLVEKHILEDQKITPDLNVDEAWKTEFIKLTPRFEYSGLNFQFLMKLPADKKDLLFSPSEMCKAFSKCSKNRVTEEEQAFEKAYEMAEMVALEKQKTTSDDNFNLNDAIENEFGQFLDDFYYNRMTLNFTVEFIVPKSFLFSYSKLKKMLLRSQEINQEKLFDAIYKLTENKVAKRQAASFDPDFNFNRVMKSLLDEVLDEIKFPEMKLEYVIENIVDKRFLFTVPVLYELLLKCKRSDDQEELFFKAVYELAEKNVTEKQEEDLVPNFDLKTAVKEELMKFLSYFKFNLMSLEFLTDFVGFTFNALDLNKLFLNSRKRYSNEAECFQAIYVLAEKQAHEKQKKSGANFSLVKTIKEDLSVTLQNVQYYLMDEIFLMDFVVKNGMLSIDAALHVHDYRVVITNDGKTISGSFVDTFGIKDALGSNGFKVAARAKFKQRFNRLKFPVPTTKSPLQMMKGGQWYLLLEQDGSLGLKFSRYVANTDYLIAEMKSQDERFELTLNTPTTITNFVKE
uniref:BTB domain-containing protein n=1 Tax=Panagrolaimus sp. ES5 TaxID=591445 RepID=A0AC34FAQ3_9BILA